MVAAYDLDTTLIDDVKFFTQTPLRDRIHCEQMDALRDRIHSEQMDGFEERGYLPDDRTKLVCRLKRGLEGLKQSGNNAQVQCVEHLVGPCQLTQLISEPTIFTRTFMLNCVCVFFIMLVWIDDKWAAFSRGGYKAILVPFLKVYNRRFKSTNLMGDVKRFIAIDLNRDRDARTMSLSQEKYISDFVPKFVDDIKGKLKPGSSSRSTRARQSPRDLILTTSSTISRLGKRKVTVSTSRTSLPSPPPCTLPV